MPELHLIFFLITRMRKNHRTRQGFIIFALEKQKLIAYCIHVLKTLLTPQKMANNSFALKLVECPRDAMQGLHGFIPTATKIKYLNALLAVNFHTLDFGSFVSPKAIPQLRDTAEVLEQLQPSQSELLAIVANLKGAEQAAQYKRIKYLGFPLSVSETFQKRNTNKSIEESMLLLSELQDLCHKHDKILVVYISMGFGNPYGELYAPNMVGEFVQKLDQLKVQIVSLSDTTGVAKPELITELYETLLPAFPHLEIGAHFHSVPQRITEKIKSAYEAGCRRFDGAMRGFGGCPMAADDLTGNLPTEALVAYFRSKNIELGINEIAFEDAYKMSASVFAEEIRQSL